MNNKLSILLVVASMLALMVFLGTWLVSSYRIEKDNLRTDLEFQVSKAKEEVKDSIFFVFIEKISDTLSVNDSDTVIRATVDITNNMYRDIRVEEHVGVAKPGELLHDFTQKKKVKGIRLTSEQEERDINISGGAKFVFRMSTGDSLQFSSFSELQPEEIDLLVSKLQVKLLDNHLPDRFELFQGEDSSLQSGLLHIMLSGSNVSRSLPLYASFFDFHWYILEKLVPQILFSLLLLSVVGGAFYLLAKTIREQEKYNRLKSDFINNMTHELKTPIATVSVAIEAFQNFDALKDREKTKTYLDISKRELNRLRLLVDKVLKMSQFESASTPLGKMTENDLQEIIQNVSNSMQLQFEKYHASFCFHADSGEYLVKGDRVHLTNIIYNLLDNALKYGGNKTEVILQKAEDLNHILLKVRDNGVGIAKEYQDKVFDRFFRIPESGNTHNVKGYGLGLHYVAEVVKAHGGRIRLRSGPDQGTEFIIELPHHG